MVKLVEALGTKYIYETWRTTLTRFLEEHKGEVIDLADARLTSMAASVINAAISSGQNEFCDTANPERDAQIKFNAQAFKEAAEVESRTVNLPIPRSDVDVDTYMSKAYDPTICYKLSGYNNEYDRLWAIILQAARPDVRLYTVNSMWYLMQTIRKYYHPSLYAGSPVRYLDGQALSINENPDVAFCVSNVCIPKEFGEENLFMLPKWEVPIKNMLRAFRSYLHHTGYHIKDFLQQGT